MANTTRMTTSEAKDAAILNDVLDRMSADCPVCRYELRGLTGSLCPECGSELRITIGLVEPRQAAYVTGIVGLASGAGFSLLILMWVGWSISQRNGGPDLRDIVILGIQAIIEIPLLFAWIRLRGWLRRRSPATRWVLAASTFVLTLLLSTAFFTSVS